MSKRRATEQLQPAVSTKRHEAIPSDRARLFKSRLTSLNQQFASWVSTQVEASTNQLWLDGVQQYQDYVRALLEEFRDIVGDEAQLPGRQRDVALSPGGGIFSTPVAGTAAAGGNSRDQSAAALTGGSTGRKSVTWADSNTALTPAPAAANGTPNPHTAHAGHTPAPANLGRDDYGTPIFKLHGAAGSTPTADAAVAGKPSAQGQGSMSFGAGREAPASKQDAAAEQTPGSVGGFSFGGGSFGTPVSAAADAGNTAKAGDSTSTPPAFTFGTPTPSPAPGATPADKTAAAPGPSTFSFGTPAPARSEAGTGSKGDTPTFGLAADNSSDKAAVQEADTPPLRFGVPQDSGVAGGSSSPAFSFGVPSTTAAGSDAAAGGTKACAFSFGATSSAEAGAGSSSAAAGSSGPVFGLAAAGSSGNAGGGGGGAFSFGAGSSSASGVGTSSAPAFTFGSPATPASAGGNSNPSSAPAFAFGTAGSAPAFGAAASAPAFGGAPFAFGSLPAANGAPASSMFQFPAPAAAAGGAASAAAAAAEEEEGDEAEQQEERTEVQADGRWTVLHSMKVALHLSEPQDDGTHKWSNKGKGMLTFRRLKEGPGSDKTYIIVTSDGGKQLVAHAIGAQDNWQQYKDKKDRVILRLVNTLYTVKKGEGEGAMPETVVQHKMRTNILKFASDAVADEFKQLLAEYKPQAAA